MLPTLPWEFEQYCVPPDCVAALLEQASVEPVAEVDPPPDADTNPESEPRVVDTLLPLPAGEDDPVLEVPDVPLVRECPVLDDENPLWAPPSLLQPATPAPSPATRVSTPTALGARAPGVAFDGRRSSPAPTGS